MVRGGVNERQLRPTVVVRLEELDLHFQVKALIDTGATRCLFPRGAAEAIGIDLPESAHADPDVHRLHRVVGGDWWSQSERIRMTLPPFDDVTWEAEVDFLLDDPGPLPFALLGQTGFLDHWVVTFNYYRSYMVVEHQDDFETRLPLDQFEELQERFPDPMG